MVAVSDHDENARALLFQFEVLNDPMAVDARANKSLSRSDSLKGWDRRRAFAQRANKKKPRFTAGRSCYKLHSIGTPN